MGVSSRGRDATVPEGAQIGLGVRTAAIRPVQIQGALTNTGNSLDLAINGLGCFQVTTPNGDTVYTRDGAFNTNAPGSAGHDRRLSGVADDHRSRRPRPASGQPERPGHGDDPRPATPQHARPTDASPISSIAAGLQALGGNLFQQTAPPGAPTSACPATPSYGVIQQGYLEASNVDPVSEITNLISAQRAYEMNSKVIQAADQMSGTISNLRS